MGHQCENKTNQILQNTNIFIYFGGVMFTKKQHPA